MKVEDATMWLEKCLRHGGFDFRRPNPFLGWQIFKRFAAEPIDSDGGPENEGLWFETGDGDLEDDAPGYFDFVRQFFKYEDGFGWPQHKPLQPLPEIRWAGMIVWSSLLLPCHHERVLRRLATKSRVSHAGDGVCGLQFLGAERKVGR